MDGLARTRSFCLGGLAARRPERRGAAKPIKRENSVYKNNMNRVKNIYNISGASRRNGCAIERRRHHFMDVGTQVSARRDRAIAALSGIHAATICPLGADYAIDEDTLASHVLGVMTAADIRGLLINGHAGENAQLTSAEKRRVIEVVRAALGPQAFLTCGIYSENSLEAAAMAGEAEDAGADALLVFPPNGWSLGQDSDAVVAHHRRIAAATRLPLLIYQAPVTAGRMAYPVATLCALVALPSVAGIKEGSWEVAAYEENRRATKAVRPDLAVLGSGDEHLLVSYLIGSEGSQVSLAAVTPGPVVALWRAAQAGDWARARTCHDVIYPLAAAIYRQAPGLFATARLKACLKILGRLRDDRMRPPAEPLGPQEYRRLESALRRAGL
jgi:4-hydroxy-tetrahydrodipicolinate synthase